MIKAKTILKNKFWILEKNGVKIASLQQAEDGITLMMPSVREKFKSKKELHKKYKIVFEDKKEKQVKTETYNIDGYICKTKPYNQMYDLKKKLHIFTKTKKSKSYFCAGYYIIKFDKWSTSICPKLLTLSRYDYVGPFKTEIEMEGILKKHNE